MQTFISTIKKGISLFGIMAKEIHTTQKPFLKMTEKELSDADKIRQILKTRIPKHNDRSLKGLYHGKKIKTGNKYCFSDKATRRTWKPNTTTKEFYSEILKRKINIEVTTKALRCMRKYGGFDNYILLTKPQKMDSLYGEYLRKLMLTKLNNPEFEIPYIVKSKPIEIDARRKYYKFAERPTVYLPKDQRFVDLYLHKVRGRDELTKKELAQYKEMDELSREFQDIQTSHPILAQMEKEREEEMKLLEPTRREAIANFERRKNKKAKALIMDMVTEAQQQGFMSDIGGKEKK